jgi:hypothetical protein
MANFARIDKNGIVVDLVKIDTKNNVDSEGVEREHIGAAYLKKMYGVDGWIQTSFNKTFRKNYATIGGKYDADLDMFLNIKMYPSWIIDESTGEWVAPKKKPLNIDDYSWNETTGEWDLVK